MLTTKSKLNLGGGSLLSPPKLPKANPGKAILSILAGFLLTWTVYILVSDEEMLWAKHHLPLDAQHIYTIEVNESVYQVDGSANPEGGYVYTKVRASDELQQLPVAGRLVGSSTIDLTPYIDKPVTIEGKFYRGRPLLLRTDRVPEQFTQERVVLHIESVTPVAPTSDM